MIKFLSSFYTDLCIVKMQTAGKIIKALIVLGVK